MELKEKVKEVFLKLANAGDFNENHSTVLEMFMFIYNEIPVEQLILNPYNPKFEPIEQDGKKTSKDQWIDLSDKYKAYEIARSSTMIQINKKYPDSYMYFGNEIDILFLPEGMLLNGQSLFWIGKDFNIPQYLYDNIIYIYQEESSNKIYYVLRSERGYEATEMDLKDYQVDIHTNYNDDLPYDKIVKSLESDDSGIIVLNGVPGSGKTHLLRHLTKTVDKKFLFVNTNTLGSITDASFIRLLLANTDSIFVLEDCEDILEDRGVNNNQLSTLLNLSDGLLGDSLNLKFICTFNTDLKNIDPAVLRKGRLKCKYEFKALTPDKTYALGQKLGKSIPKGVSLTLSDIYNYEEDNGAKVKRNKIGF